MLLMAGNVYIIKSKLIQTNTPFCIFIGKMGYCDFQEMKAKGAVLPLIHNVVVPFSVFDVT